MPTPGVEELAANPTPVRFLGESLWSRSSGQYRGTGIATVFPAQRVIVTLPGIHVTQRLALVDQTDQARIAAGQPPLGEPEKASLLAHAVDLILQAPDILIRPDPQEMNLALQADDLLQELAPKSRIKFLLATDPAVRRAIKQRGECWRVVPPARSDQDMQNLIRQCRVAIQGEPIYYYNRSTGTRFLTLQDFRELGRLGDAALRAHLSEIATYLQTTNQGGHPEISLFLAPAGDILPVFCAPRWAQLDGLVLRRVHGELVARFAAAVPAGLQDDDPTENEWRHRMYGALTEEPAPTGAREEVSLGLAPEFFCHVEWLPGARIDENELVFDPALSAAPPSASADPGLESELIRGFILNYIRECGDLEYINIGRVIEPLALRPREGGRRAIYIVELKHQSSLTEETVQVLRLQKWGVHEHLDEGKNLLESMLLSEEYTDYVLDRRLACRQMGMNLPWRITEHRVAETYHGTERAYEGKRIWSVYYQRDYVPGTASCRVSRERLANPLYANRLARLLERAAAANLIIGRADDRGRILFDDGDEVVEEGADGLPARIVVADPTGAFRDYRGDLLTAAPAYAAPLLRRRADLADPETFLREYLRGFVEQFLEIQSRYRQHPGAFDGLFSHRPAASDGNLRDRWEQILQRLAKSDAQAIAGALRRHGSQSITPFQAGESGTCADAGGTPPSPQAPPGPS